ARRVIAALDRALVSEAALALEEQLHPLAAAAPAFRIMTDCHPTSMRAAPPRGRGTRGFSALDPPPLGRPATVMRNRRDVLDGRDLETGGLQRTDRGFAARSGPLDPHLDLLEAHLERGARGVLRGDLGGERGALAGALEADLARARPRHDVPIGVGDGDD